METSSSFVNWLCQYHKACSSSQMYVYVPKFTSLPLSSKGLIALLFLSSEQLTPISKARLHKQTAEGSLGLFARRKQLRRGSS